MAFDILQGVQYDPRNDDRDTQILLNGLNNANEQYGAVRSGLEQQLGQYGSDIALNSRDADKPYLQQKLQEITTNLPKLVQDKYAGDYGAARFDIARQLAKEKQSFDLAKAANQEESKYEPLYRQLQANGQLVMPKGQNPFEQSIFNAQGQYTGQPQYNIYKRGDYEDWVAKNYSSAFQNEVKDYVPNWQDSTNPYLTAQKIKGLSDKQIASRIGDDDAEKFLEANKVFAIEHNIDPNSKEGIGLAKDYLIKTAQTQVAEQIDNQYLRNSAYAERKAKEASNVTPINPDGDPIPSTAFQTGYGSSAPIAAKTLTSTYADPGITGERTGQVNKLFDDKGNFKTPEKAPTPQQTGNDGGIISNIFGDTDYNAKNQQRYKEYLDEFNSKKQNAYDIINKMKEAYPEDTKGKTPEQIFDLAASNKDKYAITMSNEIPIVNPNVQTRIADEFRGSPDNAEIFLRNSSGNITKNLQGKNGIADKLGINPVGLSEYVKQNKELIRWDDGEMAYTIPVPTNLGKITSGGKYDMTKAGDMTKMYFSVTGEDQHIRTTVKTLENVVKGTYNGEGLKVPTTLSGQNVNIVLPKGVVPLSTNEPVFQIEDNNGNLLSSQKVSFSFLKDQYNQTAKARRVKIANQSLIEGKKTKASEISNVEDTQ